MKSMKSTRLGIYLGLMIIGQLARAADPIETWTSTDTKVQYDLIAVAYGAGQYVAVGGGGTILSSSDGTSWTQRTSGTTNSLRSIVYGGGQFVAVGGDEHDPNRKAIVVTSKDGLSWSLVETGVQNILRGVAYGAGRFVAVGGSGSIILSSEDGIQWETRLEYDPGLPSPGDALVYSGVAYGNGLFVAVGPRGTGVDLSTSPDGITWTRSQGPASQYLPHVAYGNGVFVVVGGRYVVRPPSSFGEIWTSKDGLEWEKTAEVPAYPGSAFSSIACGGGQFLAVGEIIDQSYSKRVSYRSSDGRKWAEQPDPGMSGIGFGNGIFVGVGGSLTFSSGVIGKLEASVSPAGQVEGSITGVTGQTYAIQASTNLETWNVLTNVAITNGMARFSETPATNTTQRFYGGKLSQ